MDAVRRICGSEDYRGFPAYRGGEETTPRLPRHDEATIAGGVGADEGEADDAVQGRRRGHVEGKRLYAPNDWMYVGKTFYIHINDISTSTRFPDVLKLPEEKIELLQIGWRASDETEAKMRPSMSTSQPWQVFAWAVARNGALYIRVDTVNLTREGVSVVIRMIARSWREVE